MDSIRDLADLITTAPGLSLRYGVVTSVTAGPPKSIGVTIGGTMTPIPGCRYLAVYNPTVLDTVAVLLDRATGDVLVLGKVG